MSGSGAPALSDSPGLTGRYRSYALGLLAFINLLNYLARNVVFPLFEPIKRALVLTDAQLGWLGSAYVLVFSVAVLPFGLVSDLRSRRAVVTGGVALWSTFLVLSGLARTFPELLACRAAVGIGGAAFLTAGTSLAADYFPGKGRAVALGVLSAGLALGGGLAFWVGGHLDAIYGWRVALIAAGLPGFACAVLAGRLVDPTRRIAPIPARVYLRDVGLGVTGIVRQCVPLTVGLIVGLIAAYALDKLYGSRSDKDVAALGAAVALGLAINIRTWMRRSRAAIARGERVSDAFGGALGDVLGAAEAVFRTPTLGYVFVTGALVSFGTNGLLGWAPSLMARVFRLSAGHFADRVGVPGLAAGIAGSVVGGIVADWLRRYTDRARVITVAIGLLIGGPLALWLLTIRDLSLFVPVFCAAFFFLTWFNGPITAVIFDVVPPRISATVVGAYLLFIHLAGDAIAFPLVGALSDRFGIHNAVLVLPSAAILGGLVILGAARQVHSKR